VPKEIENGKSRRMDLGQKLYSGQAGCRSLFWPREEGGPLGGRKRKTASGSKTEYRWKRAERQVVQWQGLPGKKKLGAPKYKKRASWSAKANARLEQAIPGGGSFMVSHGAQHLGGRPSGRMNRCVIVVGWLD